MEARHHDISLMATRMTLEHPDGRRWFGRAFGCEFQIVLLFSDDEPLIKNRPVPDHRSAVELLSEAVEELRDAGFVAIDPQPWPRPEPRAGAVVVAAEAAFTPDWIIEAVAETQSKRHGPGYERRFVMIPLADSLIACYFEILGYETRHECAAFEHANFVIEGFGRKLGTASAPETFVALADVGGDDELGYEIDGFDEKGQEIGNVEEALCRLGCSIQDLRDTRQRLHAGTEVFRLPD
ncbi:hypothetical protein ACFL6C_03660 [Myxococcota bacterium]